MINPAYLAKLIEAHWARTSAGAPASISKLDTPRDATEDTQRAA